jgi:predicted DNA-binding protein
VSSPADVKGQKMAVDEEKDSRSGMTSVRLSVREQEAVKELAREKGESVSQYLRGVIMEKCRVDVPVDYRAYQVATSSTDSGMVVEAHGGYLVPRASSEGAYVYVSGQ